MWGTVQYFQKSGNVILFQHGNKSSSKKSRKSTKEFPKETLHRRMEGQNQFYATPLSEHGGQKLYE